MLEKVKKLSESMTPEQAETLRSTLGGALFDLLEFALESETEDEATERVAAFVAAAKKNLMKVLKARRTLTPEQRTIVMDFLDDD